MVVAAVAVGAGVVAAVAVVVMGDAMKHLAQALAILAKAENTLLADLSDEQAAALAEVERRHAMRLRVVQNAKKAVLARFQSKEALMEEYFGELKDDTPKETTIRLRRSQRREKERRAR